MNTLCPRCGRESLSGTVCSFCGPVGMGGSFQPQLDVAPGWRGHDRDLGRRRREERERARLRGSGEGGGWGISFAGLGSFLSAAAVIGGVWWLWSTGRLNTGVSAPSGGPSLSLPGLPSIGGLPTELKKPASESRSDLALLGRSLLEFATDAQRKFGGDNLENDVSQADIDRYRERLGYQKDTARKLEPLLTREERRVLMAFEHAIKMLDGYLTQRAHNEPDFDDARIRAAQDQIQRALAVARGEKVDNVIVTFSKKINESSKRQKELFNSTE